MWGSFVTLDLDANATYAPSPRLQESIASLLTKLGNPSALHRAGQRAKAAVEDSRNALRLLVGARQNDHVIFTSGATEANNLIVHHAARHSRAIVSSTIEHPCILQPLQAYLEAGGDVRLVSPTEHGCISAAELSRALSNTTALVSIMGANNETGVVNDLAEIVAVVRSQAPGALIHSDVAQVIGKARSSFKDSGLDAITISGHKFGALPGVGALIVRHGVEITPLIRGGAQEGKLRGGTENVLGIISLGEACREVLDTLQPRIDAMRSIRDTFESLLLSTVQQVTIQGATAPRLPNTSSVTIAGVRSDDLVVALDQEGILASSGAACSSGKPEPSHVLLAMGLPEPQARATIRISFRADQPPEIATRVVTTLARIVDRIRKISYSTTK